MLEINMGKFVLIQTILSLIGIVLVILIILSDFKIKPKWKMAISGVIFYILGIASFSLSGMMTNGIDILASVIASLGYFFGGVLGSWLIIKMSPIVKDILSNINEQYKDKL